MNTLTNRPHFHASTDELVAYIALGSATAAAEAVHRLIAGCKTTEITVSLRTALSDALVADDDDEVLARFDSAADAVVLDEPVSTGFGHAWLAKAADPQRVAATELQG